jgi:hypothetical protein
MADLENLGRKFGVGGVSGLEEERQRAPSDRRT